MFVVHPRNVLRSHFVEVRPTKLISTQNVGLENINYNVNTIHKQNLTMNITAAKHNLSFNADSQKWSILINLAIADLRPFV